MSAYAEWMDDLEAGAQPRCPHDGVLMRTTATSFECPLCRHPEPVEPVTMPAEFDGPDIHAR